MPIISQPAKSTRHLEAWCLWGLAALLLISNVPIFLCQHLTSDAVIYDLQARCALDGGVLYRDIVEPNLPGAVWWHMLVRSLLGWSWMALRAADLLVLAGITWLLCRWVSEPKDGRFSTRSAALVLAIFGLHFSMSEWCHCQRDLWMLLPALGALTLRRLRVRSLLSNPDETSRSRQPASSIALPIMEGIFWGAAFWMKPHIAVPALAVLIASLWICQFQKRAWYDLIAIIAGGAVAGAVGSAWLIQSGAWPHFWEMQWNWNPRYLEVGRQRRTWARLGRLWQGLAPWSWMHLLALGTFGRLAWKRFHVDRDEVKADANWSDAEVSCLLLGSLYVGWVLQVVTLQHPFAYVQMPVMVLALALVASWRVPAERVPMARFSLATLGLLAAMTSVAVMPSRIRAWPACITEGPTPKVRAQVQVEIQPDWRELQPVTQYLQEQQLHDKELVVYSGRLIHLYSQLAVRPPTRYVYLDVLTHLFGEKSDEIASALAHSPIRYVVSSLREDGMSAEEIAGPIDPATKLPVSFPEDRLGQFPYTQPVVFRSGEYLVHAVTRPVGRLSPDLGPLARRNAGRRAASEDAQADFSSRVTNGERSRSNSRSS